MIPAEFPLVAVVGPTAAGKSELGLIIAERFSGEIVNCDSLQIYRRFDIGTAKPTEAERRGIPHHMIDVADPAEPFTAGEYAARTRPLLRAIAGAGRLPVVVGGTGFYLKALLEGLFPGPGRDESLRARLAARQARRPGSLHRLLRRLDPVSASRIHPNDVRKTARVLEITLIRRQPASRVWGQGRDALQGFRALKIGLDPPRAALYERIRLRSERMFESGLIDEVRAILASGCPRTAKPLESHGYRQSLDFLEGRLTYQEAVRHAVQNTCRYAKRQWTWFRRDPEVRWLPGFGGDAAVSAAALKLVEAFLKDFAPRRAPAAV